MDLPFQLPMPQPKKEESLILPKFREEIDKFQWSFSDKGRQEFIGIVRETLRSITCLLCYDYLKGENTCVTCSEKK
jgi:hypothetical protein